MSKSTPRWELEDALRRARTADRLLERHTAKVTPRLDEGTGAQLKADIALLGGPADGAQLGTQKTATATEREIAADAHDLIMLMRNALRRSPKATQALRTAMGVGQQLNPAVTKAVLDALAAIATHAPALRECRIAEADIEEAASLATRLQAADATQKGAQGARTGSTEDRIDAQLRLEAAIDAIHVAGTLAFRKDAAIRGRFERLVSSSGPSAEDQRDPPPDPTP